MKSTMMATIEVTNRNERQRWLARDSCLVNGRWVGAFSGERLTVRNPANGVAIGTVPAMQEPDITAAVDAVAAAFDTWRRSLPHARATLLRNWFDLIQRHREELARILTREAGKPLTESLGEVDYASSYVEWYAEEARRGYGDVLPTHQLDKRLFVVREPVGPVAAITSWNFPLALITRKVAPALAAGCTVIVKPALQTPFSALALGELAQQAGFPAGIFNIVTGNSREIGAVMLKDSRIRKLTFTGSTDTGKTLMRTSADTVKRLSLELGGNAPFIVFEDANIDQAVEGAMAAKFRNAGQTCVCANRFLVHSAIYDEFATKLKTRVATLKVADGFHPGSQIGPLIDEAALRKVENHIADAISLGARIATGGTRHQAGRTFFAPTVLLDVTSSMLIAREETFGPVAPLFRFENEQEAIHLANSTEFGLAAYFFCRDVNRAWRVAERIESGMVGINTGLISTAVAPFGGIKESGMGREGSRHGLDDYTYLKYLCLRVDPAPPPV
jgi:succinate-semialdehyde dehydrogenase/glutarate-semialdehyde dehydrogenase